MVMKKKKNTPPESWLVFIIIQVPSGYLLRVSVAGPSGRWLAGLPGGPRSARAWGGDVTQIQSQRCLLTLAPGRATLPPVSLQGAVTLHCACSKCLER